MKESEKEYGEVSTRPYEEKQACKKKARVIYNNHKSVSTSARTALIHGDCLTVPVRKIFLSSYTGVLRVKEE
jgi:hypothetical protein